MCRDSSQIWKEYKLLDAASRCDDDFPSLRGMTIQERIEKKEKLLDEYRAARGREQDQKEQRCRVEKQKRR